jgi:hypothetical protein
LRHSQEIPPQALTIFYRMLVQPARNEKPQGRSIELAGQGEEHYGQ